MRAPDIPAAARPKVGESVTGLRGLARSTKGTCAGGPDDVSSISAGCSQNVDKWDPGPCDGGFWSGVPSSIAISCTEKSSGLLYTVAGKVCPFISALMPEGSDRVKGLACSKVSPSA